MLMKHWCSATTIASSLQSRLEAAGLSQLDWNEYDTVNKHDLILIYAPPDQILEQWRIESGTAATTQQIEKIFRSNASRSKQVSCSISNWRLGYLDTTSLIRLANDEVPVLDRSILFPEIKALSGLITLNLLKEHPDILDHYLDLEIRSFLCNLESDSDYVERLKRNTITDLVLMNWWTVNEERESSWEEVMTNLGRLHQIQNDYDQLVEQHEQIRRLLDQQNALSRRAITQLARLQNDAS